MAGIGLNADMSSSLPLPLPGTTLGDLGEFGVLDVLTPRFGQAEGVMSRTLHSIGHATPRQSLTLLAAIVT